MGIDSLLQFLKPITQKEHLSTFHGQNLGIDISPWLYKGCYNHIMYMDQEMLQLLHDNKCEISASTYLLEMINLLAYYQIKPYFVFDGRSLPMKKSTIDNRIQQREHNKGKIQACMINKQIEQMRKFMARSLRINQHVVSEAMQIVRMKQCAYMIAPYEADSQLAKLKQLGIIDGIITEDSDLLVYGCNALFKLSDDGQCDYINIENYQHIANDSKYIETFVRMTWEERIIVCVMSGCDYVDSIKGIGIKRAIKYLQNYRSLQTVLKQLKIDKVLGVRIDQDYQSKVLNAIAIFKHALTYNPHLCRLESYTQFMQVENENENELSAIIGHQYDGYIELQVYLGKVQARTLSPRIFPKISIKQHTEVNILRLADFQRKNNQKQQIMDKLRANKQQEQEENMLDALAQISPMQSMKCGYRVKLPDMVSETLYQILIMNY